MLKIILTKQINKTDEEKLCIKTQLMGKYSTVTQIDIHRYVFHIFLTLFNKVLIYFFTSAIFSHWH